MNLYRINYQRRGAGALGVYEDAPSVYAWAEDKEEATRIFWDVIDCTRYEVVHVRAFAEPPTSPETRLVICPGCGNKIDPGWCACGDPIDHRWSGHYGIPIGCDCGRELPEDA